MKVLLVDDQVFELRPLFERINAEVFYAENEWDANKILVDQPVDVILMDGNLGSGVCGVEVVRRLRTAGVTTKILMFSSDDKLNKEGIAAGANGAWSKRNMGKDGWKEKLLKALK